MGARCHVAIRIFEVEAVLGQEVFEGRRWWAPPRWVGMAWVGLEWGGLAWYGMAWGGVDWLGSRGRALDWGPSAVQKLEPPIGDRPEATLGRGLLKPLEPSMNARERVIAERYRSQGWAALRNGAPDFVMLKTDERGRILEMQGVEVKKRGSKLSHEQKVWREVFKRAGIPFVIEELD